MGELADAALLGRQSEDIPRHSSLSSNTLAWLNQSESNVTVAGTPEKPLPPLPSSRPTHILDQQQEINHVLGRPAHASYLKEESSHVLRAKAKGFKAKYKGLKRSGRPEISHPILQVPDHDSDSTNFPDFDGIHRHQAPTQLDPSTTEGINLGRMISSPMQQAAAETALLTPKAKENTKKESPLQRGKQAFLRKSRALADAFADRLSSSGERRKANETILPGSSPPAAVISSYQRLHHPIAEGEDLPDPRARLFMGDDHSPRTSLPGYHAMESQSSTPPWARMDDTSSDLYETGPTINRTNRPGIGFGSDRAQSYVDINHEFSSFPQRIDSRNWPIHSSLANFNRSTTDVGYSAAQSSTVYLDSHTRYDDRITGLEQHRDVEVFASCPSDYSTSSDGLESPPTSIKQKHLTATSSSYASSFVSDIEVSTDENLLTVPSRSRRSTGPSVNSKRKSVTEDPRSDVDLAQKRAKRTSIRSDILREDVFLANNVDHLDTGDLDILAQEDTNGLDIPREDVVLANDIGHLDTGDHDILAREDTNGLDIPREDVVLANDIGHLDTGDHDILAREDTNTMDPSSDENEMEPMTPSMRRLTMNSKKNGKQPVPTEPTMETPQGPSTQPTRSSNRRPRGQRFSQFSWGEFQPLIMDEDDQMEIDELQTNDEIYQMGTNMD